MLDDNYYIRFDTQHKFIVYFNNSPVYGKELLKVFEERYPNKSVDDQRLDFEKDINEAYREYARVCHIPIIYDTFTKNMKNYIKKLSSYERPYLCEYQSMTRKDIFMLFEGASMKLLYEVSLYLENQKVISNKDDTHEEIFE